MKITLDGSEIKSKQQFHTLIKLKLDLPDFYGENLDALWDCLTGFVEMPLTIVWINSAYSKEHMPDDMRDIVKLFQDVSEELSDFNFEIK